MRIAVIGASGQVGTNLVRVLSKNNEVVALTHEAIDITDSDKARKILLRLRPEVVMNTAAYHKTDECEVNPEKSFSVNSIAVRNLALISKGIGSLLVHFSTDYVFDGEKREPYSENDRPNPVNVYGVSKLAGEVFVRNILGKHFIVRPSGVFGKAEKEGKENFVVKMLRLARERGKLRIVADQTFSPTYARDMSEKIAELLRTKEYGTYHITNSGVCSWYELAMAAFELAGVEVDVSPVKSDEFPSEARRPLFSVLENKRLSEAGLAGLRHWKDALADYLREIGEAR